MTQSALASKPRIAVVHSTTILDRVLSYQNLELIERFKDKLGLSQVEAEERFYDLKQFLYLCGTRPGIWSPTKKIDDAWHEFILYTQDYADFCDRMFRRMIHHVPRSYLGESSLKGRTWAAHLAALEVFGSLSANWDVPENMRPKLGLSTDDPSLEIDPCGDGGGNACGCGAACNGSV